MVSNKEKLFFFGNKQLLLIALQRSISLIMIIVIHMPLDGVYKAVDMLTQAISSI